jgi:predicted lipoprotein with Yx(FWY)xxD motif
MWRGSMFQQGHDTHMRSAITLLLLLVVAGCGGGASYGSKVSMPPPAPANPSSAVLPTATLNGGPGFTTSSGFTVYTFDADTQPNVSACATISGCTGIWPPVPPPAGTLSSPWSSFTRSDGKMQLAYGGKPLYTYAGDSAPGQTNGDNLFQFGATWHIARPQGASPSPATATPMASASPMGY